MFYKKLLNFDIAYNENTSGYICKKKKCLFIYKRCQFGIQTR